MCIAFIVICSATSTIKNSYKSNKNSYMTIKFLLWWQNLVCCGLSQNLVCCGMSSICYDRICMTCCYLIGSNTIYNYIATYLCIYISINQSTNYRCGSALYSSCILFLIACRLYLWQRNLCLCHNTNLLTSLHFCNPIVFQIVVLVSVTH